MIRFNHIFNFFNSIKNIKLNRFTTYTNLTLIIILVTLTFSPLGVANTIEKKVYSTKTNNITDIHDEYSNKIVKKDLNPDLHHKAKVTFSFEQTQFSSATKLNEDILTVIQNNTAAGDSDQNNNKAIAAKRNQIQWQKQRRAIKTLEENNSKRRIEANNDMSSSRELTYDYFYIYDAYTQLIEDLDSDSFYQTFSITFDADINSYYPFEQAQLYAELYLRKHGGPWEHYYTTDNFIITGDSPEDSYQVYSTLDYGFNSEYYDVLIDLYEVGQPYRVASYSSDDNNSLSALPLESSDNEHVTIYAASNSVAFFSILVISLIIRLPVKRITKNKNQHS